MADFQPLLPIRTPERQLRLAMLSAIAIIFLYLATCGYYVLGSSLGGHGETSVISTAWVFSRGQPLYPSADAAGRYAMVYGPMSAGFAGLIFWIFGPQMTVVRIAGGLLAIGGLACCWRVYRRIAGAPIGLLTVGWLAMIYLKYTIITFYVRPDAALQCCMALALLATFALPRSWAWVVLAVAVGWGINLKITMPIYVLPLFAAFRQRHGFLALSKAAVAALALMALPFVLLPEVSLQGYWDCLTTAFDEGTERTMILPVGGYLGLLSAPPLCALALLALQQPARFKALAYRHRFFGICSALSFLLVLRITGKPGAGPSHLLPLFPMLGVVLAKTLAELRQGTSANTADIRVKAARGMAILFLIILLGFDLKGAFLDIFANYRWSPGIALTQEVNTLADRHPGVTLGMGVGSSRENYDLYRYQPVLVLRGNPYILDVPAMMDMQKAGRIIPQSTHDDMADGKCRLWLIPRGEAPFEMRNWYEPRGMIFDDAFREIFHQHYQIVDHSEHFDVWEYQNPPPVQAAKPWVTLPNDFQKPLAIIPPS